MKEPSLQASYLWGEYWRERGINPPKYQQGDKVLLKNSNLSKNDENLLTVQCSYLGIHSEWLYLLSLEGRIDNIKWAEQELIGVNDDE